MSIVRVGLAVLLVAWVLVGCSTRPDQSSSAWRVARDYAASHCLWDKEPVVAGADDPGTKVVQVSDTSYAIRSWIKSKNGYGVILKSQWTCLVFKSSISWLVTSYQMEEHSEEESLPRELRVRTEAGRTAACVTEFDDWMDYNDSIFYPNKPLPNGRVFNMKALIDNGQLFYLDFGTRVQPKKRDGMSSWFVTVTSGPLTGKSGWISAEDAIQTDPAVEGVVFPDPAPAPQSATNQNGIPRAQDVPPGTGL